ncbi:ABC transporter permease [Spirochaetota bacterium]
MRGILAITKREMRSYFSSPVAYIVMTGFLFISGYFFSALMAATNKADLTHAFNNMAIVLFLLLPFVTMKLLSEEKKTGTFELLQTSPLTPLEIVIGKYASAVLLFSIMLALTLLYPVYVEIKSDLYWPTLIAQYLGLFLLGTTIIGIGLCASAFTENQIISGIVGFAVSFALLLISWVGTYTFGITKTVIEELTIINHFDPFLSGMITLKDVIYFLLWIVATVFVSTKVIESQSWRT